MDTNTKTRENRLRLKADRMGYRLCKSRRRDPDAYDYGLYYLIEYDTGLKLWTPHGETYLPTRDAADHLHTLDGIEAFLASEPARRR